MLAALITNHLFVLGGNAAFMRTMVERGMLGRKTGKGFYLYPKEAKKSSKEKQINPEVSAEHIFGRVRMIELHRCLSPTLC